MNFTFTSINSRTLATIESLTARIATLEAK